MKRRNKNSVRKVSKKRDKHIMHQSKLNSIILVILFTATFSVSYCEMPVAKTVEANNTNTDSSQLATGSGIVETTTAGAIQSRFHEVSDTVTNGGIDLTYSTDIEVGLTNNKQFMEYAIRCAYELGKKDAQEAYEEAEQEEREKKKQEKEKEKKQEKKKDYHTDGFGIKSSIMCSSGLTGKQIDGLLIGTDLYGIGGPVKDIEDKYGVNAYFTIAVASLESSYGSSNMAKRQNNIFGMLGHSFNNYSESVYFFGRLMDKYKNERGLDMSPYGINPTYCTDGSDWDGMVTSLMNTYVRKANEKY